MANGSPGDHPYTDIVIHKRKVLGEEIDNLVRELQQMPGFDRFKEEVCDLLVKNEPPWNKNPDFEFVKKRLYEVREHLIG